MTSENFPNLTYVSTKVGGVLTALCVPNIDRFQRLIWAYDAVCELPPAKLPNSIEARLTAIHSRMSDETKRRSKYRPLHHHCLRAMSWKRREAFAQEIIDVCLAIVSAAGEQSGRVRIRKSKQDPAFRVLRGWMEIPTC